MYTYLDPQNGQQGPFSIQRGPFSLNRLFGWCKAGQMPPTTRVRRDQHLEAFRALSDVPGFYVYVRPPPPPPPQQLVTTWTEEQARATLKPFLLDADLEVMTSKVAKKHMEEKLGVKVSKGDDSKEFAKICLSITIEILKKRKAAAPPPPDSSPAAAPATAPAASADASSAEASSVPRPTIPSLPDAAQLPESFAVYVEALQADMKCPACHVRRSLKHGGLKHPFTFASLTNHLKAKADAQHVTWRAQNAELLVQLRVETAKDLVVRTPEAAVAKMQRLQQQRRRLHARMPQPERAESAKRKASELWLHEEEQILALGALRSLGLQHTRVQHLLLLLQPLHPDQRSLWCQHIKDLGRLDPEDVQATGLADEELLVDEYGDVYVTDPDEVQVVPEQMQDMQAAGLADEVAGLRARLAEETQARQRAEMAQEEMRAAKRARITQSDREATAVAWRDAAGSAGAMEVVDSDGFMARFLAFRQARSCHLHAPSAPSDTARRASVRLPLTARPAPPRVSWRAVCRIYAGGVAEQDDQGQLPEAERAARAAVPRRYRPLRMSRGRALRLHEAEALPAHERHLP